MKSYKRFKFRFLVPKLVSVITTILGSRNRVRPVAQNFFFIIGTGRNGSTLLSAILNNNPEVFIPPEQYVLPFFASKWQINRFNSRVKFNEQLINTLLIKRKTVNWELTSDDYSSLNPEIPVSSYFEMINSIFELYAQKKGKKNIKVVGEKSPMNTHFLKLIIPEFKGAKFIFLIRDPRAVIYSFSKVPNHEANDLEFAIWKWKDSVQQYKRLKKMGHDVMLLSYEELVMRTENKLKEVHSFLGLSYPEGLLDDHFNSNDMGVSDLIHHQNLSNPINSESIGKWRSHLPKESLLQIQKELADAKEFGYDLFD